MAKRIFIILFFIFLTPALPSSAESPNIKPINITPEKGKKVSCEGHIYSIKKSNPTEKKCSDNETVCSEITVEDCSVRQDVDFLSCYDIVLEKSKFEQLNSNPLVNSGENLDILQEMEKKGIKQGNEKFLELYTKLATEKISKKPSVRVRGKLYECASCENCYPASQCSLSSCTIEFLEKK